MHKIVAVMFGVLFGFAAVSHASESTKAIVASYLQIHAALSADKTDGVSTAAGNIVKEAGRMGASGEGLVKAAKAVESAANLKAARDAFGPLSDAVIEAATADDWKDVGGVKIGYCPMLQKSWIQKDGQVNNPYYGSQMLTCGELKTPPQGRK